MRKEREWRGGPRGRQTSGHPGPRAGEFGFCSGYKWITLGGFRQRNDTLNSDSVDCSDSGAGPRRGPVGVGAGLPVRARGSGPGTPALRGRADGLAVYMPISQLRNVCLQAPLTLPAVTQEGTAFTLTSRGPGSRDPATTARKEGVRPALDLVAAEKPPSRARELSRWRH